MNPERMEKLDSLLPQVLPQVDGCPVSMARDALQFIASDFCKVSGAWERAVLELVPAGEIRVPLHDMPRDARLASVLAATLAGTPLSRAEFSIGAGEIVLRGAPCRDAELAARVTLRPERLAGSLPEFILEEWGDIIAFGALAKLKTMSGANVTWTDPQGAQVNLTLYNEGIYAARTRIFRNGKGGGILFANA